MRDDRRVDGYAANVINIGKIMCD